MKMRSEYNNIDKILDLKFIVSVELGKKKMIAKEILDLKPGDIIRINKTPKEPVDIYINKKKFAEGEIIKIKDDLAVRLSALIGADDRLPELDNQEFNFKK